MRGRKKKFVHSLPYRRPNLRKNRISCRTENHGIAHNFLIYGMFSDSNFSCTFIIIIQDFKFSSVSLLVHFASVVVVVLNMF